MNRWALLVVFLAVLAGNLFASAEDDAARGAYLAKRAMEQAAAEQAVKDLSERDQATLSADELIRLSYAYNELGDDRLALDAVCRVPDDVLAAKKQLDLKATCFGNVASSDDKSARIRELAFIDRCLDKKYGSPGVWLWRKARLLCQSSVLPPILTVGDVIGDQARIVDREQYEYSFELLKRAFAVEPGLLKLSGIGPDFTRSQDFPLLSEEDRFKELMKKSK